MWPRFYGVHESLTRTQTYDFHASQAPIRTTPLRLHETAGPVRNALFANFTMHLGTVASNVPSDMSNAKTGLVYGILRTPCQTSISPASMNQNPCSRLDPSTTYIPWEAQSLQDLPLKITVHLGRFSLPTRSIDLNPFLSQSTWT